MFAPQFAPDGVKVAVTWMRWPTDVSSEASRCVRGLWVLACRHKRGRSRTKPWLFPSDGPRDMQSLYVWRPGARDLQVSLRTPNLPPGASDTNLCAAAFEETVDWVVKVPGRNSSSAMW